MNKTILMALLGSVSLISCGGGAKRPTQDPQGFWQGTALNNRTGWGFVQSNGRYLLIISGPNGNHTLETVQTGTFTTVDGSRWLVPDVLTITQTGFPFASEGDSGGAAEFMTRSSWSGRIDGSPPLGRIPIGLRQRWRPNIQPQRLGRQLQQLAHRCFTHVNQQHDD